LYAAIREGASALEHVGAFRAVPLNVEYATGTIELGSGGLITPATFEHLPFRPLVGRPLNRLDGERNAPAVVVIRESLWDRRLGRDPNVVGQRLSVGGELRTVVGVLPDDATFPLQAEIWLPLQSAVLEDQRAMFGDVQLMGVLSAGATVESAEQQLGTRAANWRSQHADVEPLAVSIRRTGEIRGASAPGGLLVAMLIGLVIVVAGNVANLVIARTASRRNELAVRTALGAARSRLVAQLSLEVLLVGAIAAGIGLWTSQYILRHLVQSEAEDIPVWVDLGVSPRVFLFVVAIALLVTVVAGLMPALRATRGDVSQTLRGGRSASSRMFGRFDDAMIVAQIALSIGILGAATMIHKGWMQGYGGRDLPIPSNEVLLATIAFAGGAAPLPQDSLTLLRERIETALAQVPGVLGAGTSTHMPGSDAPAQRCGGRGRAEPRNQP
jgi:hypothetical protein